MPVRKLFDGVDFPELQQEDIKTVPVPLSKIEQKQLKNIEAAMSAFHTQIMRVINAIQSGESNLRTSINLKGSAILSVIDRMSRNPNKTNIEEFFQISQQDLGRRVKQEFERILDSEECEILKTL